MQPAQDDRYLTAAEMLEDFASDAGTFETPAMAVIQGSVADAEDNARWEKRLRRALGDDYELLNLMGTGGFGGSTGYATSSSNGRWPSRCCSRCSPGILRWSSDSGGRRSWRRA
jgi:hypothetical protein